MTQDKCKQCKHYKEGLDIDYVPSHWCKLNNFDNVDQCEHYKDEYTIKDYIEDVFPGICMLIGLVFLAFFMSLVNK